MRCDRCGYSVPEWLWVGDDHPIIVENKPMQIVRKEESVELNAIKLVAELTVLVKMCKDVHEEQKFGVNTPFFHNVSCALCKRLLSATEPQFKCCPRHTAGPEVVCNHCYTSPTIEHGQKE